MSSRGVFVAESLPQPADYNHSIRILPPTRQLQCSARLRTLLGMSRSMANHTHRSPIYVNDPLAALRLTGRVKGLVWSANLLGEHPLPSDEFAQVIGLVAVRFQVLHELGSDLTSDSPWQASIVGETGGIRAALGTYMQPAVVKAVEDATPQSLPISFLRFS